jgi:SRSO17 transposase
MVAGVDPLHASARHQALHHFVANADWSDEEMLRRISKWVVPKMDLSTGGFWIIDDTGFSMKGKHSVGVARQYCGVLGKQDNCQVAVSISLACEQASVPVAYQLYLPREWAVDTTRREKAGIPDEVRFATKTDIALQQLESLLAAGAPKYCVLADAGYGVDNAFRQRLSDLGLPYVVGITSAVVVWPPVVEPLPPKPYSGIGRPPVMPAGDPVLLQRESTRRTRNRQPISVKDLAHSLPPTAFQTISWREGSNETLNGRFAAVRDRSVAGRLARTTYRPAKLITIPVVGACGAERKCPVRASRASYTQLWLWWSSSRRAGASQSSHIPATSAPRRQYGRRPRLSGKSSSRRRTEVWS